MSEPFVLKLKHAIVSPINKAKIDTVTMRQPLEASDFLFGVKAQPEAGPRMILEIVARTCGLVAAEVEKLAYSDYKKLAHKVVREINDEDEADEGKE